MPGLRIAILALSALGTLLFGGALALSIGKPLLVERAAREVARIEVERRVNERINALSDSRITALARKALLHTDLEIERTGAEIRNQVSQRVAATVADMLDPGCECRRRVADHMASAEKQRLRSLLEVRQHLGSLIEASYASVSQSLMREFRIFTASNAVAFALLGLAALARRRARLQLLLPALVMVGAVAITSGLYLFNQDWLHTIVFGQYLGLGYSLYLLGVVLLLADIAFNRTRAITGILNVLLNALGSAASVTPC
jgi:hypothetical protein